MKKKLFEILEKMKKELYHGSNKKFKIVEPRGVNMSTRFNKPKCSSYWWETEHECLGWTIFQKLRRDSNIKCWYHIPNNGFIVLKEDLERAKKYLINKNVFIYKTTQHIHNVGIGSSPDIKEFTIDFKVKPDFIKKHNVTINDINTYIISMDTEQKNLYFKELESGVYSYNRGILLKLLLDRNKDIKRHDIKDCDEINQKR